MKLTTLLLLIALLQASAKTFSQVTLNVTNAPVEKVLESIKKQTGYVFLYDGDLFANTNVSIQVNNVPVNTALEACFKNLPFTYKIVKLNVVIQKKEEPSFFDRAKAFFAQVAVQGKVTNELDEPMAGVTVKQKGSSNVTSTDTKGLYSITVPDDKTMITFSYIGYETQELAAKDIPNGSVIKLKPQPQNLHEVVINKGYYSEKQELSTSDVSVVSAKTIGQQPVSDPIQALIGQVAGLNIQQTSGVPGSYATIHIRGLNSIANGNDPYYIIDGVPFSAISLSDPGISDGALGFSSTSANNGSGLSPFNSLNPDDIESIEILKDADATSIYGTKGANGVIIITTKKGKAGETKVNVNLSQGIGQVGHFMDLLNTQQYLQMRHQAYSNDGITTIPSNAYDVNGAWDTTRYTNWEKVLIGNTAHYTNGQASISGGSANTQFLIGGGYYRSTTVYPGNSNDQKGSLHFTLTNTSSNQKFKAVLTASYVNENNDEPSLDFANDITLAPDAPALYNANGSLNWQILNGSATWHNPLARTLQFFSSVTDNLISNLNLSYEVFPGLTLSSSFGYNHDELNQTNLTPATAVAPPNNTNPGFRSLQFATNFNNGWIMEPQLNYKKKIGRGQFNALLGGTLQQNTTQYFANIASGFASDALIGDPAAATTYFLADNQYSLYRYEALVARIGYTWEDKYLLNLTANRDGSSRFGPGRQYGNFGSIGAGWIFSKEKSVQDAAPWLSFGKLRASYGTTGNDQIGNYQFLSTYSVNTISYQNVTGLNPVGLTNPYYSWEVDKKLEGGLDLGFLTDRIDLSLSYYRNRTANQLVGYPLPSVTGFSTVQYNLPAVVQNAGLELTLHTINIKTTDFNWMTSVNFTLPNNKLVSYPGIAGSSYNEEYVVGQSLFIKKVFEFTGVNPQTGLYNYVTTNSDKTNPNYPQDLISSQPVTQKYYGGIDNNFAYKGFGLDVVIQFVKQLGYNYLAASNPPGYINTNFPTAVLSAWHYPGQITNVEKFSTAFSNAFYNYSASTGELTDASFIRVKNVELYYRLPAEWQGWAHMQNARIYFQGQNLYTFTHYIGLDPENPTNNGLTLPPLRVIMLGISAQF